MVALLPVLPLNSSWLVYVFAFRESLGTRLCNYCFILHYIVNLVQECYYHEENKVSNYIKRYTYYNYHIEENFWGRKLSWISRFCGYTRKFSPWNLGRGVLWHGQSEQSAKVFSVKIVFSPICKSFLPQKFTTIRYTVVHISRTILIF